MTRNDLYKNKGKLKKDVFEPIENKDVNLDILHEMIDEYNNTGNTPWTIFLSDIGEIDVLYMTGVISKITGEHDLLVLDNEGKMWQIKEQYVIARRTNIMNCDDCDYFNEMKKQFEENTKKWEETEKELGLNNGFM